MGAQPPIEDAGAAADKPQEGNAIAGGIGGALGELAGRLWREMQGQQGADGNAIKPQPAIDVREIPLHKLENGTKVQLGSGAMLSRWDGQISLGSAQFSANPPVGWHMQFDKTGQLIDAQGVKKVFSENGIAQFKTPDGQTITIDKQGLLKVSDGKNITVFPRPKEMANNLLPNLEIAKPQQYMTNVNGDGTQSVKTKDGTQFQQYKDGTVTLQTADGHRTKVSPDGMLTVTSAEGKTVHYNLAEAKKVLYKDGGSVGYSFPDGTFVVQKHRIAGENQFDTGLSITTSSGARVETFSTQPGRVEYTPAAPAKALDKKKL